MNKDILHLGVDLLSRREHSKKELLQKMQLRDYAVAEIEPVLSYLLAKDYQSDERFADCILRTRVSKGYGWRHIQNELAQKGVAREIVNQMILNHQIDWYLQAQLAYNKRFGASLIKDHKDRAKRIRFMQHRGFSTDEIMTILNANTD